MSATPTAVSKAPAKSKKLIVIGALVAVLLALAVAVVLWLMQRSQYDEDAQPQGRAASAVVPTYLPIENMVVNLADAGGERFAQIGITLELQDEKTASTVKQYMPSIRNGILMLVSQRSADALLLREGKEKLAADILQEVSRPLGLRSAPARDELDADEPPQRRSSPVRRVLFSSFIIQ